MRENPCIAPRVGQCDLLDELGAPQGRSTARFAAAGSPVNANRLLHKLRADGAVGAAAVVDHDRLLQTCLERNLERPRHDVGGAAGREGHDEADRPAGEGKAAARAPGRASAEAAARTVRRVRRGPEFFIVCLRCSSGGEGRVVYSR